MATAEDLVILKAVAARPKDLDDIEALLILHPAIDVEHARRSVRELADLAEEPAIVQGFERVVCRAKKLR